MFKTPVIVTTIACLGLPLGAQSEADRSAIAELVVTTTIREISNAVPDWIGAKECDVRSPDFYACQYYLDAGPVDLTTGRPRQPPQVFGQVIGSGTQIDFTGPRQARTIGQLQAECKLTRGVVFGRVIVCNPGVGRVPLTVTATLNQVAGKWTISTILATPSDATNAATASATKTLPPRTSYVMPYLSCAWGIRTDIPQPSDRPVKITFRNESTTLTMIYLIPHDSNAPMLFVRLLGPQDSYVRQATTGQVFMFTNSEKRCLTTIKVAERDAMAVLN